MCHQLYQILMLLKAIPGIIVALFTLFALTNCHFSRKFYNLIETNTKQFIQNGTAHPQNYRYEYTIIFQSSKNTTGYTFALAHQDLFIWINNFCYAIHLHSFLINPASLKFILQSACSNRIQSITFRYLIIMPIMIPYVLIFFNEVVYNSGYLIRSSTGNRIQKLIIVSTTPNIKAISVLQGYELKNQKAGAPVNYIDLVLKTNVVSTSVIVQITGNSDNNQLYLYYISFYTIVTPNQFTVGVLNGGFQTGILAYGQTKNSVSSQYNPRTVFIGVSRLTNQWDKIRIQYAITINPTDISILVTNDGALNQYQLSYINFIYLPCNITDLYFYQPNRTCIPTCPILCSAYLIPNLCGQCGSCQNNTYSYNNTCMPCKSTCINCTSLLACTGCIDKYQLRNGTCVPNCSLIANQTYLGANFTCQPCNSSCLSCSNSTYCTACNSSYFVSFGLCLPNCTLIANRTFLGANRTCQLCPSNCLQCSNTTSCSLCNSTYFASNGLCLPNCTLISNRTFLGPNRTCQICPNNCLQCSNTTSCSLCNSTYFLSNGGCVPNCTLIANQTFLGINFTCQRCAPTCLSCSNMTSCNVCNSSFFLSNGECIPNCTLVNTSTFLSNKSCTYCNKTCLTCANITHCISCIDLYKLQNNSCVVNCSLSTGCLQCKIAPRKIIDCTKCVPGLLPYSGVCLNKCGDGLYRGSQQGCDDGNLDNGDGCSSNCSVEQPYWSCISSQDNVSSCVLKQIDVLQSFVLKDPKSNSISIHFNIYPTPSIIDQFQWEKGIATLSMKPSFKCLKGYFNRQSSKLIIEFSYENDLSGQQVDILFDFSKIDSRVALATSKTAKVSMVAQNNLSLQVYSTKIYLLSTLVQNICLFIASLSLLMLLGGYFSGRLIALQNLAIVQLTYLCLLNIKEATPTFEALRILRISIGSISFDSYDYSSSIDRSFKGSYVGLGIFTPPNFSYIFVLLPILVGVIVNVLSRTKWKDNETVGLVSLRLLGEFTFYGLVFAAYFTFSDMIIAMIVLREGKGTASIANAAVSIVMTVVIGIHCFALKKYPQHFGVFTQSFSKYGIDSVFYVFVVAERFLSTTVIVLLRDTVFGLTVEFVIILSLLVFILYNKPCVNSNYRRQKINGVSLLLILLLSFLSELLVEVTLILQYAPLGISLLLLASTASNSVYFIKSLKKTISQLCPNKSSQSAQSSTSMLQSMFQIKKQPSIQQKNQLQFKMFQRRLFGDSQQINLIFKEQTKQIETSYKNKQIIDYEWQRYDVLTRNKVIEDIRNKLRAKTIATQSI